MLTKAFRIQGRLFCGKCLQIEKKILNLYSEWSDIGQFDIVLADG